MGRVLAPLKGLYGDVVIASAASGRACERIVCRVGWQAHNLAK